MYILISITNLHKYCIILIVEKMRILYNIMVNVPFTLHVYQVKEVTLDKKVLERYIELEKQTRSSEGRNVIKTVKAKKEELEDLNQTVKQLQSHYEQCTKQT